LKNLPFLNTSLAVGATLKVENCFGTDLLLGTEPWPPLSRRSTLRLLLLVGLSDRIVLLDRIPFGDKPFLVARSFNVISSSPCSADRPFK